VRQPNTNDDSINPIAEGELPAESSVLGLAREPKWKKGVRRFLLTVGGVNAVASMVVVPYLSAEAANTVSDAWHLPYPSRVALIAIFATLSGTTTLAFGMPPSAKTLASFFMEKIRHPDRYTALFIVSLLSGIPNCYLTLTHLPNFIDRSWILFSVIAKAYLALAPSAELSPALCNFGFIKAFFIQLFSLPLYYPQALGAWGSCARGVRQRAQSRQHLYISLTELLANLRHGGDQEVVAAIKRALSSPSVGDEQTCSQLLGCYEHLKGREILIDFHYRRWPKFIVRTILELFGMLSVKFNIDVGYAAGKALGEYLKMPDAVVKLFGGLSAGGAITAQGAIAWFTVNRIVNAVYDTICAHYSSKNRAERVKCKAVTAKIFRLFAAAVLAIGNSAVNGYLAFHYGDSFLFVLASILSTFFFSVFGVNSALKGAHPHKSTMEALEKIIARVGRLSNSALSVANQPTLFQQDEPLDYTETADVTVEVNEKLPLISASRR